MNIKVLQWGLNKIDFKLVRKVRKAITIKVHPNTLVEVLAPLKSRDDQVLEMVRMKAPWILKQIDLFNTYKPATAPRRFISGETHLYLGRQYRLKIVHDNVDVIKAYRGQLWMHSQSSKPDELRVQLDKWYKLKALSVFNELLQEVFPKFKRYKISEPALTIRIMSKRWGSCTPSGKIILNTELIKAPQRLY